MKSDTVNYSQKRRYILGLSMIAVIALMHIFRVGSNLEGKWLSLYYSYASDFLLPFGFYFLLCISELKINFLRNWYVKAGLLLCITILAECLQYFGFYALGETFDPVDIVMYIAGVGAAVILERFVFRFQIPDYG